MGLIAARSMWFCIFLLAHCTHASDSVSRDGSLVPGQNETMGDMDEPDYDGGITQGEGFITFLVTLGVVSVMMVILVCSLGWYCGISRLYKRLRGQAKPRVVQESEAESYLAIPNPMFGGHEETETGHLEPGRQVPSLPRRTTIVTGTAQQQTLSISISTLSHTVQESGGVRNDQANQVPSDPALKLDMTA